MYFSREFLVYLREDGGRRRGDDCFFMLRTYARRSVGMALKVLRRFFVLEFIFSREDILDNILVVV